MDTTVAKYRVKLPFTLLMSGQNILSENPAIVSTEAGFVKVYPPGSQKRSPTKYEDFPGHSHAYAVPSPSSGPFWEADTLWAEIEANDDSREAVAKSSDTDPQRLERETVAVCMTLLRILRKKIHTSPFSIPPALNPSTVISHRGNISLKTPTFLFKVVPEDAGLNETRWREATKELADHVLPDLYDDFLMDAKAALVEGDYLHSTIYGAIAGEVFIKSFAEKMAKKIGIDSNFWRYFTGGLKPYYPSVMIYFNQVLCLFKMRSLQEMDKQAFSKVERLFQVRNRIMHSGRCEYQTGRNGKNHKPVDARVAHEMIEGLETAIKLVREQVEEREQ